MPRKKVEEELFYASNFHNVKLAPIQEAISRLINTKDVTFVTVTGSRQYGKTWGVIRELVEEIYYNPDEVYGVCIPLDTELERFITSRICDVLGKDDEGRKPVDLESVMVPYTQLNDYGEEETVYVRLVKKFEKKDTPVITFFNNARLMFFAGNANPEQHIPGNALKMMVMDEYSKFPRDIAKEVAPALAQKNGVAIAVSTLNENNPYNWFLTKHIKDFEKNGKKVVYPDPDRQCGLDVYVKSVSRVLHLTDAEGNRFEEDFNYKTIMIRGRLSECWKWVHNGLDLYKRSLADLELGVMSEAQYKILYECDADVADFMKLSTYTDQNQCLQLTREQEKQFKYQIIGYDHGTGRKDTSNAAWAKVAAVVNPDNPLYQQYIILDSGRLEDEDAETSRIASLLDSFELPVFVDATLFNNRFKGEPSDIHQIVKHAPRLRTKTYPAGGKKVNDSKERVRFWLKGMPLSKVDSGEEIYYTNPLDPDKVGCQIYIAVDKNEPEKNACLIDEIKSWQKIYGKDGELKEDRRAVIDVWDAASMGILSYQKQMPIIKAHYDGRKVDHEETNTTFMRGSYLPAGYNIVQPKNY